MIGVTEVAFRLEPVDEKVEPLTMEHIMFPLGLWLAGLVLSALFLLAEIIHHRINYRKVSEVRDKKADVEDVGESE